MGYSPYLSARALKTNRTYGIGVLFAEEARSGLTHDYFSSVLDSFKRTAEKSGYDITFINSCKNRPDRMSYLEHSRYRGFDGVVLDCIDIVDPEVIELVQSSIPVVTIDYLFNNRFAIKASCSSSSRRSKNSFNSLIGKFTSSEIERPPTFTYSASGFNRLPLHTGQIVFPRYRASITRYCILY